MRWAALAFVGSFVVCTAACSVERDLTPPRFSCDHGGPCDGADSGVVDGGGRDGGPARDGGTPACLPGWGLGDACGGTLDGSWTLFDVCGGGWFERELQDTCPGSLVQRADIVGTGRLSFDATGMTYTVSHALEVDADFTLPRLCRPTSCAESGGLLQIVLTGEVVCTENGNGCDCTYDGPIAFTQDGDYELDGNRFVLDPATASEIAFPYCVDGARLTYAQFGTTFIARR